ncbi:TPA: beta strand repeat-containing protein, partial [Burkholderia stabilis]
MGQNLKLTGVALSVATVFGVLASGSAVAGVLDALPIPQVIVNPPTNSVSVGLVATGTSPLGSVTVAAGGSGSIQTSLGDPGQVLSGAVGAVAGALGGGGTVTPLAPVQGLVNQVAGALSGGNPAGALTGALNTATGTLSNAVGTVTGALG